MGIMWGFIITLKLIWLVFGVLLLIDFLASRRYKEVSFKFQNIIAFLIGFIVLPSFWTYYIYINGNWNDFTSNDLL